MKYKIFTTTVLAILFLGGIYQNQSVLAQSSSQVTKASFPNTTYGKRGKAFYEMLNSKGETPITDFIKNHMVSNKEVKLSDRILGLKDIRNFLGNSTFIKVGKITDDKLDFYIKTSRGSFAKIKMSFDARDGGLVNGIDYNRADEDEIKNAGNEKSLTESELVPEIEKLLNELVQKDEFSGTVLVAKNGKPIFTSAYGYANQEAKIKNQIDTKFNIGSINKMFTTLAIGMLADDGKLSLNDKIGKLLPNYPNKDAREKVTIRHLLKMSSGIGDIFGEEYNATPKTKLRSIKDYLPLFAHKPLLFEPGTDRKYSNGGFLVLGAVIEKASGKSYYDFVRERIFKPLGMKNTDSYEKDSNTKNMAKGYTFYGAKDRKKRQSNYEFLPAKGSSGGGGYSTAYDLLKFGNAINTPKMPVPKSLAEAKDVGEGQAFIEGLGFGGGAQGISSVIETKVRGKYSIIVLSNYDAAAPKVSRKIVRWIQNMK